jgi:MFS family permease
MEMSSASGMVSIVAMLGIPFTIVGGTLSDKLGSRRWFSIVLIVITAISFGIIPLIPTDKMIFAVIAIGVFSPMVMPPIVTAVTEVLENERMAGLAMGLLSTGQNLGFVLGSAGFGAMVQASSWNVAFYTLIPVTILSGIFMMFNKKVR